MERAVTQIKAASAAEDGAGVKLLRVFPEAGIDSVDPFLLLDHFGSSHADDYVAGFPMHPHRGIETITYMLKGQMQHRDSEGNQGTIGAGEIQWMTSGRGIMHEEMPAMEDGELEGMQLWLNMAAKDKMSAPKYQQYNAEQLQIIEQDGQQIRLIAGELLGHTGHVQLPENSQIIYADIRLNSGSLTLDIPAKLNGFVYLISGEADVAGSHVPEHNMAVLGEGESLQLSSTNNAHLMLAAGLPFNEPVARYGPFVMNTMDEIKQTLSELRAGTFPPKEQ